MAFFKNSIQILQKRNHDFPETKLENQVVIIILIISSVYVFIYFTVGKQFKAILKRSFRGKISTKLDDLGSVSEGEKTVGMETSWAEHSHT